MKKVLIIGCPGSGKSTFARSLKEKIDLPIYYLDMIWHKPDKTTITKDEFDEKLNEILNKDEWIIDGNFQRTLEMRLNKCDTVFLLDFPLEVSLEGVQQRIGKKRVDLPWIEDEFDEEFKKYITNFREERLPKIYEMLEKYKESKNIIIFKTRDEINLYLNYSIKKTKVI